MSSTAVRIQSRDGGEFGCHVALPSTGDRVPAIVLASAIHGVDADILAIAGEFAAHGFIAAAPDLFWRSIPGPLPYGDERASQRSQPRLDCIKIGESDLADVLAYLHGLPNFNGRAVAMGFCFGGPYAILGPKRLGFAAGISCHGSRMLDYAPELDGVAEPVCIIWGDQDHAAPVEVLDVYRGIASRMSNVEVHIFPGVLHGYMMRGNPQAFHRATRDFSMMRALSVLDDLRGEVVPHA